MQLITGVWSAEVSHLQNCSVKIFKEYFRHFTPNKMKKKEKKMKRKKEKTKKVIAKMKEAGGGGVRLGVEWGMDVNQELKLL